MLPHADPRPIGAPDREPILRACSAAHDFFVDRLTDGWVPGYLADRALGRVLDDADWSVGYAPGDWNAMTRFLTRSGFSSQTLLAAGLTLIGRTGCIDR
jgi:DNA primase